MTFKRFFFNFSAFLIVTCSIALSTHARVILLNGTSSAGKSSVVREFITLMPHYKALSIDDFMIELFNKEARHLKIIKNNECITYIDEVREYIERQPISRKAKLHARFNHLTDTIAKRFHHHVAQHAAKNPNIIIDDVLTHNDDIQSFFEKLAPYDVTLILAYCPFTTLPKRVAKRNGTGIQSEYRPLDAVLSQFSFIYKPTKKKNNLMHIPHAQFDQTIELSRNCLGSTENLQLFKNDMKQMLLKKGIKAKDGIYFKPRLTYDHTINTENSPHESAKSIKNFINSNKKSVGLKTNVKKFQTKGYDNKYGAL